MLNFLVPFRNEFEHWDTQEVSGPMGKNAIRWQRKPFQNRTNQPISVGAVLPNITRKAFKRFGFPATAILTDWAAIVGAELAAYTRPERIKWRKVSPNDDAEMMNKARVARATNSATLVLRVDGARAVELQHKAPQLIERVNAYFGYRAITDLRLVQAPIAHNKHRAPTSPRRATLDKPSNSMDSSADPTDLQGALDRLAAGVASRQ